jgi:glycosyltransferase involved in cell wall biosynthesis
MTSTIETPTPARRTHVMQIVGNAIVGGMETYVLRLVERLPRERFQITAVVPYESRFSEQVRRCGAEVLVMPMPDDPPWASIASTAAFVKSRQVDVIQCHLSNAHLLGGLVGQLTATPVLFTNHGRQIGVTDLEVHRLAGTHISVVCQYTELHALGLGLDPRLVHLIPNGVDTEVFTPKRLRNGPLRQRFGIGPDVPVVGFVGRLSWEKGPETFLRSMLLAHQALPQLHAVMVGDGPMQAQVQAFIQNFQMDGFAHLAGLQDDMPAVLAEFDLVVSASHTEAMPLALMEAMGAGLPVVGTRVGGVPDLIQHGITGYLAGPSDIDGLAQSVRTLLQQPQLLKDFGERARERAVRHLSLKDCVTATAELLTRLARQRAEAAQERPAANEALVVKPSPRNGRAHNGAGNGSVKLR